MSNKELEPLYKKLKPCCDDYICTVTGNKCHIATKHFTDFRKSVEYIAKNKKNFTFFTHESNLCATQKCPVWNNVLIKIAKFAKSQNLQK